MNWLPAIRWVHGWASAAIGGGASAVTAAVVDPQDFNFSGDGLKKLLTLFAVNAVVSSFFYLKTAPLPDWDGEDRRV